MELDGTGYPRRKDSGKTEKEKALRSAKVGDANHSKNLITL